MEDFVVVNRNMSSPIKFTNPVEQLLQNTKPVEYGLSMRQIKQQTKLSTRTVNYYIYNSSCIENTNPYIHGSWKSRIRVFNYTPVKMNYHKRNDKKKTITPEMEN